MVAPIMLVGGVYGEDRLVQSLVAMNEAAFVFWHVVFAVPVGLSVPDGLLLSEESLALSVALSFCSVFILRRSRQYMKALAGAW